MNSINEQQIQELLDTNEINKLLVTYGRSLDWLDKEAHASIFWPDAYIDYGFFKGSAPDWVETVLTNEQEHSIRRFHFTGGLTIKFDGDKAQGESYTIACGTRKNEQGELVDRLYCGRFLDEYEKREGKWRISKRSYHIDWTNANPHNLTELLGSYPLNCLEIPKPNHPQYRKLS